MSTSIEATLCLRVSPQTLKNALDGRFYSLKKVYYETNYMNRMENKIKRRDYLRQPIELTANGKAYGRSKIGQRAAFVRPISQGENMHVVACISKDGLKYYKHRFESLKKVYCYEAVCRVLRRLSEMYTLSEVMQVLDNAPCNHGLEEVFGESEFERVTLLWLDSYFPMLNPIEDVFSVFKAEVKRSLRVRRELIIAQSPAGTTITAHRTRFLEQAADRALPLFATSILCGSCHLRTKKFHERVWDLADMSVVN